MTDNNSAPELFTICQRCRDNGEREYCYPLSDVRWDGEMWSCEECWDPEDFDHWETSSHADLCAADRGVTDAMVDAWRIAFHESYDGGEGQDDYNTSIRKGLIAALQSTEAVAKPFKMAISNDTMKQMIESASDDAECEAGYLATPPTGNTALVAKLNAAHAYQDRPESVQRNLTVPVNMWVVSQAISALASREAPPAVTVQQAVKRLPVVWQTDPDDAYGVNARALVSRDDVLRALGGSN